MNVKTNKYLLACVLSVFSILSMAQNRQGNIVEYFGKEKVEEINEGKVIHIFKEGLILKLRRFGMNSSSTPKNPVYSKFLLENNPKIKEGTKFIKMQQAITSPGIK